MIRCQLLLIFHNVYDTFTTKINEAKMRTESPSLTMLTEKTWWPKKRIWVAVIICMAVIGIAFYENIFATITMIGVVVAGVLLHYYFLNGGDVSETQRRFDRLSSERIVLLETLELAISRITGEQNQIQMLEKYFGFLTSTGQYQKITASQLRKIGPVTRGHLRAYLKREIGHEGSYLGIKHELSELEVEYAEKRFNHLKKILRLLDAQD